MANAERPGRIVPLACLMEPISALRLSGRINSQRIWKPLREQESEMGEELRVFLVPITAESAITQTIQ
jgi:hypothetical protein